MSANAANLRRGPWSRRRGDRMLAGMKTTVLGVLTILVAVANAAISFLKTSTFDFATTATAVTSGWGLIKARDAAPPAVAPPATGVVNCSPLAWFAAGIFALACVSCITTSSKDGTVTRRVDQEAVRPWRDLAREVIRDVFGKKEEPAQVAESPAAPVVTPAK